MTRNNQKMLIGKYNDFVNKILTVMLIKNWLFKLDLKVSLKITTQSGYKWLL